MVIIMVKLTPNLRLNKKKMKSDSEGEPQKSEISHSTSSSMSKENTKKKKKKKSKSTDARRDGDQTKETGHQSNKLTTTLETKKKKKKKKEPTEMGKLNIDKSTKDKIINTQLKKKHHGNIENNERKESLEEDSDGGISDSNSDCSLYKLNMDRAIAAKFQATQGKKQGC